MCSTCGLLMTMHIRHNVCISLDNHVIVCIFILIFFFPNQSGMSLMLKVFAYTTKAIEQPCFLFIPQLFSPRHTTE